MYSFNIHSDEYKVESPFGFPSSFEYKMNNNSIGSMSIDFYCH